MYMYMYIYMYLCMCVCLYDPFLSYQSKSHLPCSSPPPAAEAHQLSPVAAGDGPGAGSICSPSGDHLGDVIWSVWRDDITTVIGKLKQNRALKSGVFGHTFLFLFFWGFNPLLLLSFMMLKLPGRICNWHMISINNHNTYSDTIVFINYMHIMISLIY